MFDFDENIICDWYFDSTHRLVIWWIRTCYDSFLSVRLIECVETYKFKGKNEKSKPTVQLNTVCLTHGKGFNNKNVKIKNE